MTCKVIVNRDSGNCRKLDLPALLQMFGDRRVVVEEIDRNCAWSADGADEVVVCGGDGTLYNALNKCHDKPLYYVPCGTLNEASRLGKGLNFVGRANDKLFGYVCATGSFTEIGYCAKCNDKRRFKWLAYMPQVLKWYTSRSMTARINVDGRDLSGTYTLLMAVKSKVCFGFPFNKMYNKKPQLYLLGIRSCGEDCLAARVAMFAPFFRVFFCGVGHPTINKRWFMLPVEHAEIETDEPQNWCMDGEKAQLDGKVTLSCESREAVRIIEPKMIKSGRRPT